MKSIVFLYAVKDAPNGDPIFSHPPFVAYSDRNALDLVHESLYQLTSEYDDVEVPDDNVCVFCIGEFDYNFGTIVGYPLEEQKMVFRVADVMTNYENLCNLYLNEKVGENNVEGGENLE